MPPAALVVVAAPVPPAPPAPDPVLVADDPVALVVMLPVPAVVIEPVEPVVPLAPVAAEDDPPCPVPW
jgi:hypothetical protein